MCCILSRMYITMATLLTFAAVTLSVTAAVTDNAPYHLSDLVDNGDIHRCQIRFVWVLVLVCSSFHYLSTPTQSRDMVFTAVCLSVLFFLTR